MCGSQLITYGICPRDARGLSPVSVDFGLVGLILLHPVVFDHVGFIRFIRFRFVCFFSVSSIAGESHSLFIRVPRQNPDFHLFQLPSHTFIHLIFFCLI